MYVMFFFSSLFSVSIIWTNIICKHLHVRKLCKLHSFRYSCYNYKQVSVACIALWWKVDRPCVVFQNFRIEMNMFLKWVQKIFRLSFMLIWNLKMDILLSSSNNCCSQLNKLAYRLLAKFTKKICFDP